MVQNPLWKDQYVAYKRLKQLLKAIERTQKEAGSASARGNERKKRKGKGYVAAETDPSDQLARRITGARTWKRISPDTNTDLQNEFWELMGTEIQKVNAFFLEQLACLHERLLSLESTLQRASLGVDPSLTEDEDEEGISLQTINVESADEKKSQRSRRSEENLLAAHSDFPYSELFLSEERNEALAAGLREIWAALQTLAGYRDLNATALRKIVKKHDKKMGENKLERFMVELEQEDFVCHTSLANLMAQVHLLYHQLTDEDIADFGVSSSHQRTVVRGVWRPKWRLLLVALALMFLLLPLPIFPHAPEARRCLALLVCITLCWVTEAVPFFVTALAVPFLAVVLRTLRSEEPATVATEVGANCTAQWESEPLGGEAAAKVVFAAFCSETIFLVLGGLTLSAAFQKHKFERMMARFIQQRVGHRPWLFVLCIMYLGLFLSMWISNVASPVLVTAVMAPVINDLPRRSKFLRFLLLGLAFACNIGGMISPIASPQNAIAIGFLEDLAPAHAISFLQWCLLAIPVCVLAVFQIWLYLVFVLRPSDVTHIAPIALDSHSTQSKLSREQWFVLGICGLTVLLWCSLSFSKPAFGDMGIVALLPLVAFFGSGTLTKEDLKNFSWNLILLIGGGSVLGVAVRSSTLLHIVADTISPVLRGNGLWVDVLLVSLFVLFVTTFVSHTVASLILIPVIIEIGQEIGHVEVVVLGAALMVSGSMSLPMTSFPNLNALLMQDKLGEPYLHVPDFVRHGTPVSFATLTLLMSVGFALNHSFFE